MIKEEICCNCSKNSRFGGRVNGENNYYCNDCIRKIDESGINYWKKCSFDEFMSKISKKPLHYSETPMADGIRETLREIGVDVPDRKQRRKKNNHSTGVSKK